MYAVKGSVDATGNDGYHVDGGRRQAGPAWGATTISHYFPQHLASTSKLFRAPCYVRYPAASPKLSQVCAVGASGVLLFRRAPLLSSPLPHRPPARPLAPPTERLDLFSVVPEDEL